MPLKTFIFLFFCFFTPYFSYAFISQERSFEILTDQTSQLEVKLLNDFYFKLSDLIIIIDTSFEEIDSLAGKINIEGFTNDDFIMKTSKLISQAEEKISNLQNEYTLISDNSESKFDEIKEVYSEFYNFLEKGLRFSQRKINVLKDLILSIYIDDLESVKQNTSYYGILTADLLDLDADFQLLTTKLNPENSIPSLISPINISISKANADHSRLIATLSSTNYELNQIKALGKEVEDNFINYEEHKKLFDLGMNVFYSRLAALKSQFNNNDEKFIIDQFGKFLDMSKAYISSSDQLIAITKKLNFHVVKTVSDNQDMDKVLLYIKVFDSPKYLKFYNEYTAKFNKTQNLSKQMIEKIYEISVLLQEFKLNEINQ